LLSSAGPSWWWLGSSSLWTRRCRPSCGRWGPGRRSGYCRHLGREQSRRPRPRRQANKSTTALLRRTDLDWRRLTGTWISNAWLHIAAVPGCAAGAVKWERPRSDRIRGNGSQRSNATVGGEALADSSEQAHAFEVELSQASRISPVTPPAGRLDPPSCERTARARDRSAARCGPAASALECHF